MRWAAAVATILLTSVLAVAVCGEPDRGPRAAAAAGQQQASAENLVQRFPAPPNARPSQRFSLRVEGQPVFVEEDRRVSFAHFAFAGEVVVEVELDEPFESFTLSPARSEISAQMEGRLLTFTLRRPQRLVLHEVNGEEADFILEERLLIFADPIPEPAEQVAPPPWRRSSELAIDDGGEVDVTAAIQNALDALSQAGGGTLVMAPGLYRVQSLFLRDDVALYLEGGARLQASDEPSEEDAMIKFFGVDNAHLLGPGSVDANGVFLRYQRGKSWSIVRADNASNSSLDTVTLLDPSAFAVWIRDSERWRMTQTKQIDFANRDLESNGGEDGIDPDASRHVLIEQCFVYAGDDATAIKAISPRWPVIEDITLRSNVIFNAALGSGLGIGSQLERSHLRQITFENNDVVAARFPLDVSMRQATSGEDDDPLLEEVWFRGNRFGKSRGSAVFRAQVARRGIFRDFVFENLAFAPNQDGNGPRLLSFDQGAITGWTFDGVELASGLVDGVGDFEELGSGVSGLSFADSDPVVVEVRASEVAFTERDGGARGFRVRRSADPSGPLTVPFALRGTAREGDDFEPLGRAVTFPSGESEVLIVVRPRRDGLVEGGETLLLTLHNDHGTGFMVGPESQAQILLVDADLFVDGFESGDTSAWSDEQF
ncbi:MAG: glycosyl hydrolase family 28 protein [Acidobacteriota bacterium]